MFLPFVLVQFVFTAVSASVVFQDCGSAYSLNEVHIEGCDRRQPCYVTLGEDVLVNLKFTGHFVSRNLDQNVIISINSMNLPAPVTPESCGIYDCPVKTGAPTSFTSIMSVPLRMGVNQRGYLRWRIVNETGTLVLCYYVLVQTQTTVQKQLRQQLGLIPVSKNNTYDQNNLSLDTGSS